VSQKREQIERAAEALRELLSTRAVGPSVLTVSFTDNPPRLFVYLRRHGFAQDVPGRFKNLVVETHYTATAPAR
jgi:hypothetical protein